MTTPAERLQACLAFTLKKEGGYQANPNDRGNFWDGKLIGTNMGISAPVLAEWVAGNDTSDLVLTADMMRTLTVEKARTIYAARYWNPLRCDALPAGIDLMAFDFGVNAGVGRSARLLQSTLASVGTVMVDGFIGPRTLAAVGRFAPSVLIPKFAEFQRSYYRLLAGFDVFGRGWLARTDQRERTALTMARGDA